MAAMRVRRPRPAVETLQPIEPLGGSSPLGPLSWHGPLFVLAVHTNAAILTRVPSRLSSLWLKNASLPAKS